VGDHRPDERHAAPPRKGGAGGGRGHRMLAAALLLACVGGIGYFALHEPARARAGADGPAPSAHVADATPPSDATAMPREPLDARRIQDRPAADDLASVIVPGTPVPTMGEVIEGLHKAGIRTGLGAFNPPGTSPPLVGLAVPEDFVLPEGYVRHHQATDDGQAIEPILMYSPDYEFLDAAGNPVAIPADRVVPASHAPAGLPIRQVRIPPPQPDPGSSS
jgi:hypothetical protein